MTRTIIMIMVCLLLGHALNSLAQEPLVISDDKLIINDVIVEGNRITKEKIILRELVFQVGDTILKMEFLPALQRSKDNLLNLALFNFAHFDATHLPGNRINIQVRVVERWYLWPIPILEYADRNFNEFINNKDWEKINYGAWLKWSNFRGLNDLLAAKVRLGYVNQYALSYSIPNLGRNQRHGLSSGFSLNQQDEVIISTVHNVPVEYKPLNSPAQTKIDAYFKYQYRRKLYGTHDFRFEYDDYGISDSVAYENPNYLGGGDTHLAFFKLRYAYTYDIRDSKVYPLEGFKVELGIEQQGLGILSNFDYPSLRVEGILMYHQKLAGRFYFYNITKGRYSSEKVPPYVLNQAFGYNVYMSGYEPYVLDGTDYFITKYSLKLQLIKPSTYVVPFIKMEQFNKIHYALYFNLFADAGYVNNFFPHPTNTMLNTWQFSMGAGLDFVTYYDQVFRVDIVINKYGEYGFFFHLSTPFDRW